MAKPVRVIKNYVPSIYSEVGKWSKQTHYKMEVIEHCDKAKQNNDSLSGRSVKVIIIGPPGIGKTSLLLRYCHNNFEKNYKTTIGVDFEVEKCKVLDIPVNLQLWDTAGAERFKGVTTTYFRGANAVVLVFDLSNYRETLEATKHWLEEARGVCHSFELFLVGAKRDIVSDDVFKEEIEAIALEYATDYSAELWFTSAKSGLNVESLFNRITILSFENIIMKEVDRLKRIDLAHSVVERSTLIRVKVSDDDKQKSKRAQACCKT